MIKNNLFVLLCLAVIFAGYSQKERKVVFIIADGISADVIEQHDFHNLTKIKESGSYIRAFQGGEKGDYSQSPTISAVGYNNVLTGVWFNKHNVPDNAITDPNYNYPTVFRLLKDAYPNKKIAIFSSWEDNRTKLLGEGLKETGKLKLDFAFDGYELDKDRFPHTHYSFMNDIDALVAENAAQTIREEAPDLSWVYFQYTDDMGHRFGDSPEFLAAIQDMNRRVGTIWEAIEDREKSHNEEWLIIVTTDHGRDEGSGKGHGGQSDRQRSAWIFSNKKLNESTPWRTASVVDILPSITSFLSIDIPKETLFELDGYSLISDLSVIDPKVNYFQDTLDITWIPNDSDDVKIWGSVTNNKKTGGEDTYTLLGTYPNSDGCAVIPINQKINSFYKIVIEGTNNSINRWFINKK